MISAKIMKEYLEIIFAVFIIIPIALVVRWLIVEGIRFVKEDIILFFKKKN